MLPIIELKITKLETILKRSGINYQIETNNSVKFITVSTQGEHSLNKFAFACKKDFENLRIIFSPIMFSMLHGLGGLYLPDPNVLHQEEEIQSSQWETVAEHLFRFTNTTRSAADRIQTWLFESHPSHSLLVSDKFIDDFSPENPTIRHELHHVRNFIKARNSSEAALTSLTTNNYSHSWNLGTIETPFAVGDEIFAYAGDILYGRDLLLKSLKSDEFPGFYLGNAGGELSRTQLLQDPTLAISFIYHRLNMGAAYVKVHLQAIDVFKQEIIKKPTTTHYASYNYQSQDWVSLMRTSPDQILPTIGISFTLGEGENLINEQTLFNSSSVTLAKLEAQLKKYQAFFASTQNTFLKFSRREKDLPAFKEFLEGLKAPDDWSFSPSN